MENINNEFEHEAMKYVEWGKKQTTEKKIETPNQQSAPVENEVKKTIIEKKKIPEEEILRIKQEEYEEQIRKEQEKIARQYEDVIKQRDQYLKDNGIDPDLINNLDPEKVITPESDQLLFTWIKSRFPKLIEEIEEEERRKQNISKEEFEKQKKEIEEAVDNLVATLKENGKL